MSLAAENPTSLYDLTFSHLENRIVRDGLRPIHTNSIWRALHRELVTDLQQHSGFLPPVHHWLEEHLDVDFVVDDPEVVTSIASSDGYTRKLLLRLNDGQEIETVIMGYPGRFTACLSTQAGCAMGCVFCATGQMGFARNLLPGEIVVQVLHAQRLLRSIGEPGLRNVVLMGMGEPLANYDAVIQALNIITDARGANISPGRISVSTVGVVPGILRLAEEKQLFNLTVSLHAVNDQERTALVPVNHRWPLSDLTEACKSYTAQTGRRIIFGWTLIEGHNDTPEIAQRLVDLLRGMDAHINLILLNPTREFSGRASTSAAAEAFQTIIQKAGFPCTIRQRRGIDVDAGCGQLRSKNTPCEV